MARRPMPAVFADGIEVIKKIEKANDEAFFVGGCVRDLLLNKEIRDIDIATSAPPTKIQDIFKKVIPVGIDHGTVIVRYNGKSFEVTTYRLDGKYTDQRHPDNVCFINKIDEDLKRRDFTINALAMDKEGNILDLFNGKNDLSKKIIRTVGKARNRFLEDPLRMIRALRFSSQLGFSLEKNTKEQLKLLKKEIETVSVERIMMECTKLFAGKDVNKAISYLIETKIYEHLPVFINDDHLIHKLPKNMQPLYSFGEVIALLHYLDDNTSIHTWIKEWKCSNNIKREAVKICEAVHYYEKNGIDSWLVYELPDKYVYGFFRVANIIFPKQQIKLEKLLNMKQELSIQSKKDLAINGNDIVQLFPNIKSGPWIHETIRTLEKKVIFEEIKNNKNELKEWILCNPPVIN